MRTSSPTLSGPRQRICDPALRHLSTRPRLCSGLWIHGLRPERVDPKHGGPAARRARQDIHADVVERHGVPAWCQHHAQRSQAGKLANQVGLAVSVCCYIQFLTRINAFDSAKGQLKIGDLGLSRVFSRKGDRPYSHQVVTRWYRAPELLYGSRNYTEAVDLWSVGCIFGELLNFSPIFPGENDIDQLGVVIRVLGTPNDRIWPGVSGITNQYLRSSEEKK